MASQRVRQAWSDAFFAQANEDLAAAKVVFVQQPSVFCMLMQMVFEKMAKAVALRTGQATPSSVKKNHAAASRWIATLKRDREKRAILGDPTNQGFNTLSTLVQTLENCHPSLATKGSPQLEYPWEGSEAICWPAKHLPIAQRFRDPLCRDAILLVGFAEALAQNFGRLYP